MVVPVATNGSPRGMLVSDLPSAMKKCLKQAHTMSQLAQAKVSVNECLKQIENAELILQHRIDCDRFFDRFFKRPN